MGRCERVASLSVDGLDDLMLSLEEIAAIPDDVAQAMLDAEAQVVEEAQIAQGMAMGVYDTGDTLRSIRRGRMKRTKEGGRAVYVTPQGVNDKGERNAAVAFMNEYGVPSRRIPARPFIATANAAAVDPAVAEAEKVYDEWLKSKGL